MEFSGGSHANPITPGVLITFFTFGFVSKLMYNEDYSSLGKKTLPFTNIQFFGFFVSLNLFECTLVKYMIFKYIVNHIKQYMYITFQCGHVLLILLHMDDGL